jgi:MFS family permease
VWRQPDLRRLTLARLISRTGGEAAFFVGIWGRAAYEFDATPGQLALLMGVLGVFAMAGSAVGGVLVDRFGPRKVMLVGEALFAPAALTLILPTSMATMTVAVALVGFVTMTGYTAVTSFPPFLARDDAELVRLNSMVEIAGTAGFVVGPALGGVLVATVGLDWIFVLDAVTSLIAAGLAARITLRPEAAHTREHTALRELGEGLRHAWHTPALRFALGLGTVTWLSFGAFSSLEPLFFRDVLRTGPEMLGWVNTIFGVGLVVGSALVNRLPSGHVRMRTGALLTAAGGFGAILYTGSEHVRIVLVAAVVWGAILGALFPVLRTLVQSATPAHMQGRSAGILEMTHNVGELAPLLAMPALAAAFGVQQVLIGSGVMLVIIATALLPRAGRLDARLPLPPAQPGVLHAADAEPEPVV